MRDKNSLKQFKPRQMHDWYFEGYVPRNVITESGRKRVEYEYRGKYYGFGLDEAGMKQMKRRFLLPSLLCPISYVIGACLPAGLSGSLSGASFFLGIIPLVYYCIGYYGFLRLKPEFTTRELYSSYRRMRPSVYVMLVLNVLSLLLGLFLLFFRITAKALYLELLFLLCVLVCAGLSLFLVLLVRKYDYSVVRDESCEAED